MNLEFLQSTAQRVLMKAFLSSDHVSIATGKTIAVQISKNGGAFANPSGGATNATEIASGWYYVDLSTTDTGSLGPLIVMGTCTGVDNVDKSYNIVKATNRGATALPDAVAAAANGLPTLGTGAGQINPASGKVPATLAATDVTGNVAADIQTIKTQTVTCSAGVTVSPNVGGAQPLNFQGTGASAVLKVDVEQINTQAVTAAGGVTFPASIGTSSYTGGDTPGTTTLLGRLPSALSFSGTNVNANVAQVGGQAASAAAPVTFPASIGTSSYTGGDTAGTTTLLSRIPSALSFSGTSVNANITQVGGNNIPSTSVNGVLKVDVAYVLGQAAAVANGTAQGGTASTITLASTEPITTDIYKGRTISIVAGTGTGQSRFVTAYNGSTYTATVHRNWDVTPDSTSQYSLDGLIETDVRSWNGSAVATPATAGYPVVTSKVGTGTGEFNLSTGNVTVCTCNDKSGYSLAPSQSFSTTGSVGSVTGTVTANTTQLAGQTVTASSNVAFPSSVMPSGNVIVGGYASGQDPGTYVLQSTANKLITDSGGRVLLQPTQTGVTIPTVTAVTSPVPLPVGAGAGQISLSNGAVTVGTSNDKTGYALAPSQTFSTTGSVGSVTGTVIANTTQLAGQTVTAAAGVAFPSSVMASGNVNVGGYVAGQDPASLVLATAGNKLATDSGGKVILQPTQTGVTIPTVTNVTNAVALPVGTGAGQITLSGGAVTVGTNNDKTGYSLNLSQAIPTSNTAQTLGDALNAARAQGFGKWVLSGTTLTLYAADGTTSVRTFTLDSATAPTQRS
jgi:hypothetical protein